MLTVVVSFVNTGVPMNRNRSQLLEDRDVLKVNSTVILGVVVIIN